MSNKNEIFEYLIDQLRQQLPVVDVMGEIKRWSIDRSIAGRGNYTDEENAVIDTYTGLEHSPYKQQCEDLAREVLSLKNQLRDMSELVDELMGTITLMNGDVDERGRRGLQSSAQRWVHPWGQNCVVGEHGPEQSGCRKDDTQECFHNWRFVNGRAPAVCVNCGVTKSRECEHEWCFYNGGAVMMCRICGLKK